MKKTLILIITLTCFKQSFSQQDKQFTHYIFDKMSFNPAATGFYGYCGTIFYRNQWDRVERAPNTAMANLQGRIPKKDLGLGISLTNDAIGFQRNNTAIFNGAYHWETSAGTLSSGIGLGLINVGFSPNWVPPQTVNDPNLPISSAGTTFDINAGFYWQGNFQPYYIGISTTHLRPSTINNVNFDVVRHYYVLGGYDFDLNAKRKITLKPSFLAKSDGVTAIFDLNTRLDYWLNTYSYLWGGLSYRMVDAIALNIGYAFSPSKSTLIDMFRISYSFDIMTNPLNTYGKGTHELMISFCFFDKIPGGGNPKILQ